ncbi:aromatic amino acid transporter [Halalkalibacter wakoensis JCM 9140]|uniref:Aromatic amino acid transporter n=1 Tax=Halalkalibacter wakoensis JCM 9140 TaxID=1236970 RepID=W4Q8I2_9BACI|nr:amino acid permease [Halalkalibacter wakoensis]GAE28292.1 aromatic amino acid transporter [Halalkalibacter wakoensis JCM 9140]
MKTKAGEQAEKPLRWWELSLLGIAGTIGTGFFLGSSIAIDMAGPSVLFAFALAAVGTYFVYEALAKMTMADPQKGSFRSYAKNAYGRWAGFSSGWVYWLSEMLIMGSQMTALSIFTRFWFPNVPLWIFACVYAALGILVILVGTKSFDRVENLLAVLKVAAIVMFIVIAILALVGVFGQGGETVAFPRTYDSWLPNGLTGLLPAFIFGFYGFAGIEIMGLIAIRLKNMKEAPKSGKVMLTVLAIIYILSVGLALLMVAWNNFNTEQSPFVTALRAYNIPYVNHFFNAVFIIAGFSTMVASLFAVIRILVTLAEDNDAPPLFSKRVGKKKNIALPAIGLTAAGMLVSIVLAIMIPGRLYEYVTTAAGIMLLYNWIFILGSYGRLLDLTTKDKVKQFLGFAFVLLAVVGTVFHQTSRPGFYISLAFIVIVAIVTLIMRHFWKKNENDHPPEDSSLFTKLE